MKIVSKLWHDPVWSKVIASAFIAGAVFVTQKLFAFADELNGSGFVSFLKYSVFGETKLNSATFYALLILSTFSVVNSLNFIRKKIFKKRNAKPDNKIESLVRTTRRLDVDYVTIGIYKGENISIDIIAKIVLSEKADPGINEFIKRVHGEDPYCPKCFTPLNTTHASWMADGVQIGYVCEKCQVNIDGDYKKYSKEVIGEVRKNYDLYYRKYQEEINKLTHNNQDEFVARNDLKTAV